MVLVTLRHAPSKTVWDGNFNTVSELVSEVSSKLHIKGAPKLLYRGRNLCAAGGSDLLDELRLPTDPSMMVLVLGEMSDVDLRFDIIKNRLNHEVVNDIADLLPALHGEELVKAKRRVGAILEEVATELDNMNGLSDWERTRRKELYDWMDQLENSMKAMF